MRICSAILAAVALAWFVAGCTPIQRGETVVKYESGQPPIMSETSQAAEYALYSRTDTTPKVVIHLDKGARLGFQRDEKGQLYAVAGDKEKIPLPDGNYYWRRRSND